MRKGHLKQHWVAVRQETIHVVKEVSKREQVVRKKCCFVKSECEVNPQAMAFHAQKLRRSET